MREFQLTLGLTTSFGSLHVLPLLLPPSQKSELPGTREEAVKVLRGKRLEMKTIHAC